MEPRRPWSMQVWHSLGMRSDADRWLRGEARRRNITPGQVVDEILRVARDAQLMHKTLWGCKDCTADVRCAKHHDEIHSYGERVLAIVTEDPKEGRPKPEMA